MNPDELHVLELERQLLQPSVRRDPGRVAALLHDDFVEFGASGRTWTKPEVVTSLAAAAPEPSIEIADETAHTVAPGVVLVTYTARAANRSSLWLLGTDGAWRMRFHQGTPRP